MFLGLKNGFIYDKLFYYCDILSQILLLGTTIIL